MRKSYSRFQFSRNHASYKSLTNEQQGFIPFLAANSKRKTFRPFGKTNLIEPCEYDSMAIISSGF